MSVQISGYGKFKEKENDDGNDSYECGFNLIIYSDSDIWYPQSFYYDLNNNDISNQELADINGPILAVRLLWLESKLRQKLKVFEDIYINYKHTVDGFVLVPKYYRI